jgi:hypothetical protein
MPNTEMTPLEEIDQVKQAFSQIHWLDYRSESLVSAHFFLGKEVSKQSQILLEKKIREMQPSEFQALISLTRTQLNHLQRLSLDQNKGEIANQYLQCLHAWAQGAQLSKINHLSLDAFKDGDTTISDLEYALFLQNDSQGCQTGLYRDEAGDIYGWHTEEDVSDPGERLDRIRMAIFRVMDGDQPIDIYSFIYPDLMPGPAFAWRSDCFLQMVDSLYLRQIDGIMLANIAAWCILMVGNIDLTAEIVTFFTPYMDGYAVNVVSNNRNRVSGLKIEFAGDSKAIQWLGTTPRDFLFQVNIISQRDGVFCQTYEEIDLGKLGIFIERDNRSKKAASCFHLFADIRQPIFELLCSTGPNHAGYMNKHVKSYIYFHMSHSQLEITLAGGPASPNDTPVFFVYEIK